MRTWSLSGKPSLGFCAILMLMLAVSEPSYGQEDYSTLSASITVYRDGVVHVVHVISINMTAPSVEIPLVSADVQNLLVVDGKGSPIGYELLSSHLSLFSLGGDSATVEYDSVSLTRKEGSLWTIFLNLPFDARILLPDHSATVYLSDIPAEITTEKDAVILLLQPGDWEISYVLPISTQTATTSTSISSSTKSSSTRDEPGTGFVLSYEYIAVALGAVAIIVAVLFYRKRRSDGDSQANEMLELRKEDREVLQFIASNGGRALESDIRKKFVLPKTTVWRLIRRLERMNLVRVVRVGIQNEVELVGAGTSTFLKKDDQ